MSVATRTARSRQRLADRIAEHLDVLCRQIDSRLVGTPGNRQATDYVAGVLTSLGWRVEQPSFSCLEWRAGGARLKAGGEAFEVLPGPYSPRFSGAADLAAAASIAELESTTPCS